MKTKDEQCLTFTHESWGMNYIENHTVIGKVAGEFTQKVGEAFDEAIKAKIIAQSPNSDLKNIIFAIMNRRIDVEPFITSIERIGGSDYCRMVWKIKM